MNPDRLAILVQYALVRAGLIDLRGDASGIKGQNVIAQVIKDRIEFGDVELKTHVLKKDGKFYKAGLSNGVEHASASRYTQNEAAGIQALLLLTGLGLWALRED